MFSPHHELDNQLSMDQQQCVGCELILKAVAEALKEKSEEKSEQKSVKLPHYPGINPSVFN